MKTTGAIDLKLGIAGLLCVLLAAFSVFAFFKTDNAAAAARIKAARLDSLYARAQRQNLKAAKSGAQKDMPLGAIEKLLEKKLPAGRVLSVRHTVREDKRSLEISLRLDALAELMPLLDALDGRIAHRLDISRNADALSAVLELKN